MGRGNSGLAPIDRHKGILWLLAEAIAEANETDKTAFAPSLDRFLVPSLARSASSSPR